MFSMDDIENFNKNINQKIPESIADNADFLSAIVSVTNLIEKTDFSDESDRTRFQLHIINMMSGQEDIDKQLAIYTSMSLSAHISLLMISLQQSESKDNFISYFREIIIEPLFDNPDSDL